MTRKWKYVKASVIGTSHLVTAKQCQDFSTVFITKDLNTEEEVLVLVASDGAGSADRSAEGAQLVCTNFYNIVDAYFKDGGAFKDLNSDVLDSWVNEIHEKIREQALGCTLLPRDFACTFLSLIVGSSLSVASQIGDGAIIIDNDGHKEVAIWPQSGEYINTTYFITDDFFISNLQNRFIERPILEAALLTDGLQMLALHFATQSVFEPFFAPMFEKLRKEAPGECLLLNESLAEYLDSPTINERTDDDKTLILATAL